MTLPTTEVIVFDTSDLFRVNPELLEPAIGQLRTNGVNVPLYSGLEAKNPGIGFIVANWDSYEHHQEVMKAPFYAELAKDLAAAVAGLPKAFHVQFSAPTVGLDRPVTEIVLLTLKTPENRESVVDILTEISKIIGNSFVFGRTQEDENKYIAICGWESVEAFRESTSTPEALATFKELRSLVDEEFVYNAKLKKFGGGKSLSGNAE